VPVLSHGTLDSIVLYGLHANGTDLDADEIALLERLCAAAGFALDRLEAQALRREIDTLRGMVRA
jgi:GAF domain-containing protein